MPFNFLSQKIKYEIRQGNFKKAEQKNNIYGIFTGNTHFLYKGIIYYNKGKYSKSILYIKYFLKISKTSQEAYYYLIKSYLELDLKKKASFYYNELIKEKKVTIFKYLALFALKQSGLLKNIQLKSTSNSIIKNHLINLINNKQTNNSELFSKMKLNYLYLFITIQSLLLQKKHAKIIKIFIKHHNLISSTELLKTYAQSLYHEKYEREALLIFKKLGENESSGYKNLIIAAKIEKKHHNFLKAIKLLKFALKKCNNDYYKDQIRFLLGLSYQKLSLSKDSILIYKQISKTNIYYTQAQNNIFYQYISNNDYQAAFKLYNSNIKYFKSKYPNFIEKSKDFESNYSTTEKKIKKAVITLLLSSALITTFFTILKIINNKQ